MMGRLLEGVGEADQFRMSSGRPRNVIPAGNPSRLNPAGTTDEGMNTRIVLMCGAPFRSTQGRLPPSLINVGWCATFTTRIRMVAPGHPRTQADLPSTSAVGGRAEVNQRKADFRSSDSGRLSSHRTQHNAAYVAFDVAGSPRRYYAPTGHMLNRGTTNRDVSPHFDDLRPLDLQEPK